MSSEAEVHLRNMRGATVKVGKQTHLLLTPRWRPNWSAYMRPADEEPTLSAELAGLEAFRQKAGTSTEQ